MKCYIKNHHQSFNIVYIFNDLELNLLLDRILNKLLFLFIVVLKNRKVMGKIQEQRVQHKLSKKYAPIIDEVRTQRIQQARAVVERMKANKSPMVIQPTLKITKIPVKNPELLMATVEIDVVS